MASTITQRSFAYTGGTPETPVEGPRWSFGYDMLEPWSKPNWQPKRSLLHLLEGCRGERVSDATGSWTECTRCRHAVDFRRNRDASPSGPRHAL
jgi:hypothetical protein